MAKSSRKIANRYARAFLTSAERSDAQVQAGEGTSAQRAAVELERFVNAWRASDLLRFGLLNPMFRKDERKNAVGAMARSLGLSPLVERFLAVLFERDRIAVLEEVSEVFSALANERAGLVHVEIITATALANDERDELAGYLQQKLSGTLRFSWKEDDSIIGGIQVNYSGTSLDGSLRGCLDTLGRELIG